MNKYRIKLNVAKLEDIQRKCGYGEAQTAQSIGISPEQLWRLKNDKNNVGESFLAGCMVAFPEIDLRQLFYAQPIACASAILKNDEVDCKGIERP